MFNPRAAHQRIAEGVLLVEKTGVGARLGVIPRAPFVHDQADPPLRVVPVHDGGVLRDEFIQT